MKSRTTNNTTGFSFQKNDRLLKRTDFTAISKNGKKTENLFFVARSKKNGSTHSRLGLTVSKKVGHAVERNRIKRRVREYFRLNRHRLPENRDINIIAKKTAADISSRELNQSLEEVFNNIYFRRSR